MRAVAGTLCFSRRTALALGIALGLALPLAVRAQSPVNPLRQVPIVQNAPLVVPTRASAPRAAARADVFAEYAPSVVRPAVATEDLPPPEPQSVVPPQFGQPTDPYAGPRYGYLPADQTEAWPAGGPGHDWAGALHRPWFTHHDPNDPYRHVGEGQPLIGTSWLNRPWYFGFFLGGLMADDLIDNEVLSNNSYFIGGRLGRDFDHYWGVEGRYAFSKPQINNSQDLALPSGSRDYFLDVSLAYYPWGDSRYRPFGSVGLGVQTFRFLDDHDSRVHQTLLSMPIGVGMKYYCGPWFSLRFDAYDNIAFGDGRLDTMHNVSISMSGEIRFGGRTVHYFPWHGNVAGW